MNKDIVLLQAEIRNIEIAIKNIDVPIDYYMITPSRKGINVVTPELKSMSSDDYYIELSDELKEAIKKENEKVLGVLINKRKAIAKEIVEYYMNIVEEDNNGNRKI